MFTFHRLGQPFCRLFDVTGFHTGDFGSIFYLVLILRQQPFLVAFESTRLELAPGGAPLPGGITRTLTKAR